MAVKMLIPSSRDHGKPAKAARVAKTGWPGLTRPDAAAPEPMNAMITPASAIRGAAASTARRAVRGSRAAKHRLNRLGLIT